MDTRRVSRRVARSAALILTLGLTTQLHAQAPGDPHLTVERSGAVAVLSEATIRYGYTRNDARPQANDCDGAAFAYALAAHTRTADAFL